jgi:NAD(P)H-dependent flavin oxidoreductase YrpB (nitropropane dioxygenase family)
MQILTPHRAYTANDAADSDAATTAAARASLKQYADTAVEGAAVGVVLPAAATHAETLKPTAAVVSSDGDASAATSEGLAGTASRARRAPYEVFVIVDI